MKPLKGIDEDARKAQLVKTINQLLLQNGLPVTAAALRKECEKLWPKNDAKTKKNWWIMDKNEDAKGSKNKLEELLALENVNATASRGHSSETKDNPKIFDNLLTQQQQTKSTKSTSLQPPPSGAISRCPLPNKMCQTESSQNGQTSIASAITSATPKHRNKSNNRSLRRDSAAPSAKEEHGPVGATMFGKKSDSACNLSQSPPADPVRARPPIDQQSSAVINHFDMDQSEMEEIGGNEDKAIERDQQEEWLCAHLDYAAVGNALLKSAPSRDNALLVQALRQQLTRAGSLSAGATNLHKMISNDLFMLRNRKQSVLSLFLCPAQQASSSIFTGVEHGHHFHPSAAGSSTSVLISSFFPSTVCPSPVVPPILDLFKDQLSRLLNVVASFRNGRDYLLSVANGRQLLYEVALALRTKRVKGATIDNLLAALQKMSIRPFVQKELILNGMLEWLGRWLSSPSCARQSLSALEFGTALLHNLCLCPISQQTTLRHKDELLSTVLFLIGQPKSAHLFHYACGTLFVLLSLPRIRASARERGDAERTLNECMHRSNASHGIHRCGIPLAEQQRQQLAALLHMVRVGIEPEMTADKKRFKSIGNEEETFPDYLEAEIDSTDPLVPSLNDLFGYELLFRRFLLANSMPPRTSMVMPFQRRNISGQPQQFGYTEDDRESIPGMVPVPYARPVVINHAAQQTDAQKCRTLPPKKLQIEKANIDEDTTEFHSLAGIPARFERSNSMSSHSTFVVENNARRPLLVASDFLSLMAMMKSVGGDQGQWVKQERKKLVTVRSFDNLEIASSSKALLLECDSCSANEEPKLGDINTVSMTKMIATSAEEGRGHEMSRTTMLSSKVISSKEEEPSKWARQKEADIGAKPIGSKRFGRKNMKAEGRQYMKK